MKLGNSCGAALLLAVTFHLHTDSVAQPASPATTTVDNIVSAASQLPEFAPGSLISVIGSGFVPGGARPQVLIDGRPARIESANATRINALIPFDQTAGVAATVIVRSRLGDSNAWTISIQAAAPAVFQYGQNRAVAYNSTGVINSSEHPAEDDALVTIHMTGLGRVQPASPRPGTPPRLVPVLPVAVDIGRSAAKVLSAELDPERPGLYKVTVKIGCPGTGATCPQPGVHELRARSGGFASAPVALTTSTTQAAFAAPVGPRDCAAVDIDASGNPKLPVGATEIAISDEDTSDGFVKDLYPQYDTGNDDWYADLAQSSAGCPFSIGGTVPGANDPVEDVLGEVPTPGDLPAALDGLASFLLRRPVPDVGLPPIIDASFHYQPPPDFCALPGDRLSFCQQLADSPFHGKDIIYVHGFSFKAFVETVVKGTVLPKWPDDPTAFLPGGHWRNAAAAYWDPPAGAVSPSHIQRFLRDRHAKNRYILIGWSTGQRLQQAVHASLTQITQAIVNGTGVGLTDSNDPRGSSGFCARGCIVVSHSTGALVTDVAMAKANEPGYQAKYGPIGFIPKLVTTHVALAGAISGSQLATLAMVGAWNTSLLGSVGCTYVRIAFGLPSNSYCGFLPRAKDSILEDLVPQVLRKNHNADINATPVPVLTVAGASNESLWPVKRFFNRAFDDGVVAMDSGCGRDLPVAVWPSGFVPFGGTLNPRLFDLGMARDNLVRAVSLYREQTGEFLYSAYPFVPRAAAGCTPHKTPWGMLEPYGIQVFNPYNFRPNHYSFIQTTENHGADKRILSGLDELIGREHRSLEDSRSVHGNDIYTRGLVSNSLKASEIQMSRGRVVRFKLFGIKYKLYLWKRTYHRFDNYQNRSAADYAYDYVN
jgi:uncharacterized protein (TIGR03437 family)